MLWIELFLEDDRITKRDIDDAPQLLHCIYPSAQDDNGVWLVISHAYLYSLIYSGIVILLGLVVFGNTD